MVGPSVHYLLAYSSLMMTSLSTIINAPRRTALDEILLLEVSESYDVSTWNTILETLVAAMLKSEKLVNMVSRVVQLLPRSSRSKSQQFNDIKTATHCRIVE
jgi:hypothetical protein